MKGWLKIGVGAFLLPFAAMASQQAAVDDWTLELASYLWVAGIDGDATIDGEEYDLSSDFSDIIYQPGEWRFRFGYRNLNFDYEDGDDELDLSMRGLLLGLGFVF